MGLFSTEAPSLGSTNAPPWPLPPGSGPARVGWGQGVGVRGVGVGVGWRGWGGRKLLIGAPWGCRSVMELQLHLEILRNSLVLQASTQNPQDCPALVNFYVVPMGAGR